MGYFKAKKKSVFRFKLFVCFWFFFFIFIFYLSKNFTIADKYLHFFTSSFFGLNPSFEQIKEPSEIVFKEETSKDALIYLYNTHQTEKYYYNKLSAYNIDYTVMFSAYILKAYLEEYGLLSIVETSSISKILSDYNLSYQQSYKASRILLEKQKENHPSLNYFIDLHRDAAFYESTTCTLNGHNYAKIMFVIGLENPNFNLNKNLALSLNERLIKIDPCLSRGIIEKEGEGVDGVYNQDFHPNVLLIEVGGQYNLIEEVNNTLKVLASILYEYIMEDE